MKALVYKHYGSPENLSVLDIEKPKPKDDEVLIKIYAASLNSWDWDLLQGKPYIVRLIYGALKKPKYTILGADISGVVESVGKNVTKFKIGDEVFGDLCESGWGGLAEYTCAKETALAIKSPKMSFEEAAAIPQAGVMAYQSIFEKKKINPSDKLLFIGAGGGVGTMAIQFAKRFGCEITVVDKLEKFDMLKKIGADKTINYLKEDFTQNGIKYDLIIDVVSNKSIFQYYNSLNANGVFAMVGGKTSTIFQTVFIGPLLSLFNSKKLGILAHKPNKYLNELNTEFSNNAFKIILDTPFNLDTAKDAFSRIGNGQVLGKIVITINK